MAGRWSYLSLCHVKTCSYWAGRPGSTSAVHLRPFQSVVNAAARLIVKRRKYDPITDSLRDDLYWLRIHYRFYYKLWIFIYKCWHCAVSSYRVDQCVLIAMNSARSGLRSATNHNLAYPRTNLVRYGQRSFGVIGSKTWNELPADLRDPDISLDAFRQKLKTVLFSRAYYS